MRTFLRSSMLVSAIAVAAFAPSAQAAMTWGFQQPGVCAQNGTNANNFGNSWACGGGNPSLTVKGYSTGSGTTFAAANVDDNNSLGFGIKSTSEGLSASQPQHAMDNNSGLDVMLLSFTSSVILRQVQMGYAQYDSDITIMRYTGAIDPTTNGKLTGLTAAQLIANGWQLVGNYGNIGTGLTNVNAAGASSSWWLVGAYSSALAGTTTMANGKTADSTSDYVKVLTVVADSTGGGTPPSSVAEPASLALAGLALMGLVATRRRTPSEDKAA